MHDAQNPIRVMVLDEGPRLLEEAREAATRHGLELAATRSVAEARGWLENRTFDVILLPARLAGSDGVLLTIEFRRLQPHAAFLMITGLHSPSLVQLAYRAGVRALLARPMDADGLTGAFHAAHQEQLRCLHEPLAAWDTPHLWALLADVHDDTGLVLSLATPQGALLRTIGQRNPLCARIRSVSQHLTTICQTVAASMSAELSQCRCPVNDVCDAGMRRVVIPVLRGRELVGQVTACGVATEPEEPDPEMLSFQLGMEEEQAQKLARRVPHSSVEALLQAMAPLQEAVHTLRRPSAILRAETARASVTSDSP